MSIVKRLKKLLLLPLIGVVFAVSALNLPVLTNNTYAQTSDSTVVTENTDNTETTEPAENDPATVTDDNNTEDTEGEEEQNGNTTTENENMTCSSQIGALGWLLCPATGTLAKAIDSIYGTIENLLVVQPVSMESGTPVYTVWTYMRNLANIAFAMVFVVIIYSQITGFGISNYGIKRMLPKLIIAAMLVNLSFLISSAFVDLSNLIGGGIRTLLTSVGESAIANGVINFDAVNFNISDLFAAIAGTGTIAAISIMASGGALNFLLMLIPVILGIFIAVLIGLLMIALRQAVIILLVMVSPLAFVCFLLPNTEKWFQKWKSIFSQMLFFYPMFSMLFGASRLAGWVLISSSNGDTFGVILGVAVQMMPLFLSLNLMKMSGTVLGGISNRLNAFGARATGAARNKTDQYRNVRRSEQLAKGLQRPFNPLSSASWAAAFAKRDYDLKDRQRLAEGNINNLQAERLSALKRGQRIIAYDRDGKPIYTQRPVDMNRYMRDEFKNREIALRTQASNLQTENALSEFGSYMDENGIRDAQTRRIAARQGQNYLELMTQQSAKARNARADLRFYYSQVQQAAERDNDGQLIHPDQYNNLVVRGAGIDAYSVSNVTNDKAFNDATTTVIADAYDMFEKERKLTTEKYTTYFGKQVTKEVVAQYENMLATNNIDGIVAAQNTLAMRGDYDKIGAHIREYMDAGHVKLGTDEANTLALNLLKMKDADPTLGRLGKFINMETWAYTDPDTDRTEQTVTFEQFITGKVVGGGRNGADYHTKINLATGLQGTSFKGIDRTAFGDLSDIIDHYMGQGTINETDKEKIMSAIMPQLISAIPTFASGSEQITNTVGFITGLKYNGQDDNWQSGNIHYDPNVDPPERKKSAQPYDLAHNEFAYKSTLDYLAALTPNDVISMKTDAINAIVQRLTIENMDPGVRSNPSAYTAAQRAQAVVNAEAAAKAQMRAVFSDGDYTYYDGSTKRGNGNITKLTAGDPSALSPMKKKLRDILGI